MTLFPLTVYSGPTDADLARLPAELTRFKQWVLWRGEDRVDHQTGEIKLTKIPINPHTLRLADSTDPTTWGSYEYCQAAVGVALEDWQHAHPATYRGGGLGFVFTTDDPYTGIDLDHCRDLDTGAIDAWARECIASLESYTEVTPSGTGVHILVQGALTAPGRKKGQVEMYDTMRFFTMTGWHLPGTPPTIASRQEVLTVFHLEVFGRTTRTHTPESTPYAAAAVADTVILDKARAARNGSKFIALWEGDTTLYNGDDSSADLALCIVLAFWTQDPRQIDRLFRQSGLLREKWDAKRGAQTYGERTVAFALDHTTEHWSAPTPRDAARPYHKPLPGMRGTLRSLQTTVRRFS